MNYLHSNARFFNKVAGKFVFRLVIYIFFAFLVGFIAFTAELILERYDFSLMKHAVADGFVSGLALIAGLCLFELFLYGRSGRMGQLEADARKADNMLTTIAQSIPDFVYIKDAEGRHLMVNKAVEEFTGRTAQQLHGRTMADLLPPDLASSCMQSDKEPIVTGKPCRIEERFAVAGGLRILDTIKTPLRDDRGDIIGIVGVSRIHGKTESGRGRRLQAAAQAQKWTHWVVSPGDCPISTIS
jgi:PAS domain S-box-containing protein